MNLRQLRSLNTIVKTGSFAAAGDRIGLSHSAVSIQMHQLEQSLGIELFDRSHKPASLTIEGQQIAAIASDVLDRLEHIKQVARGDEPLQSVSIGFIPTCVQNLLPRLLEALREIYPDLQVRVKSELSGELAAAVIRRELDYALLTTPVVEMPELQITEIAVEPFYVIAPARYDQYRSDDELLRALPYIAFSKRTWVGQQIAVRLQQRGIPISPAIEIDSLEAIENLVAGGFGVSIVPQRLHTEFDPERISRLAFGNPIETRPLALIQHAGRAASKQDLAIRRIFRGLPGKQR